jgi:Spy/CpxP family protein refolding chaperone
MFRALFMLGIGTFVALAASSLIQADDKSEGARMRGSLPASWAKLGLSDEQKQQIYTIQSEFRTKIDDLRRQIRRLEKEERTGMEKVLTDAQRARLRELIKERIGGNDLTSPPASDKKP